MITTLTQLERGSTSPQGSTGWLGSTGSTMTVMIASRMAARTSFSVIPRTNPMMGRFHASRAAAITPPATGVNRCPWPHRMPQKATMASATEVVSTSLARTVSSRQFMITTMVATKPMATTGMGLPMRPARHPSRLVRAKVRVPTLPLSSRSSPTKSPMAAARVSRPSTGTSGQG